MSTSDSSRSTKLCIRDTDATSPRDEERTADGKEYTATKHSNALPEVRDKGYAWVIIAVMFLSNAITAGYLKSFGITYNAIVQAYPGTSAASGGVLMALLAGCRSVLAPLVAAAAGYFGYRPVMMFGVLLCSTGLFSSYFCNSVPALAVTLGAMMGVGMCSIETCQVIVLSDYFQDKKELANSIRVAGNPLGGILLPFLLVALFEYYGLRLTYIILAALMMQLSVFIFLIRPYETHQRIIHARRSKERNREETKVTGMFFELSPEPLKGQEEKPKLLDLTLLVNPLYLMLAAMMFGLAIALPQILYFIPVFGRSIGLSPEQNSALLAYQSVFDILCRLSLGFMLDKKLFKKTTCFISCLIIGGAGTVLVPFSRGFWHLLTATTFVSIGPSGYFASIHVILIDQFGRGTIASSWGFLRMLQGILNFVFPALLGLLVDVTGSFHVTFLVMGCGMLFAGLCVTMQPFVARRTNMKVTFL